MNFKQALILFISILSNGISAQVPTIENLYYCNVNAEQWSIYILSKDHFIAHQEGPNNTSLLVLYNKERLPKDTIVLGDAKHYFLQSLVPYSTTSFTCNTLSSYMNCSIVADSFVVKDSYEGYRTFPQPGVKEGDKKFGQYQKLGELIFIDATTKKGWKYPDDLWLLNGVSKKIELMSASLSNDKAKENNSEMLTINLQYDRPNELIYKMDIGRNVLLVIDAKDSNYQSISLPSIKKHNWYCFLDKTDGQLYAVDYSSNKSGEPTKCYIYDWRNKEMTFLTNLKGSPILIDNGHYFFKSKEGEKGINCFYYEPLVGKLSKKVVMDEIEIKE